MIRFKSFESILTPFGRILKLAYEIQKKKQVNGKPSCSVVTYDLVTIKKYKLTNKKFY